MTDRPDLPRRGREELEAVLREHLPNAEVWAHGRSRIIGRCHSGSDLDLVLRSPTLEPLGYEYVEGEPYMAKVRALPTAAGVEYVG